MEIHLHNEYTLEGGHHIRYSEEDLAGIRKGLENFISTLVEQEEDFNISDLKNIYIPNDYVKELYEFQKNKGLSEGHTKNELAEGMGMTLSYKNENFEIEAAIFLRAELFFGLFVPDEAYSEEVRDGKLMLLNTFFHELAHINEDYHTRKIISDVDLEKYSILPKNIYPISLGIWKEYYAYRKASERFPYGDLQIQHLGETFDWIYEETNKLKLKFDEDNDMDSFLIDFTSKIRYFLRVLVSVIGNIHGYSKEEDIQKRIYDLSVKVFPNEELIDLYKDLYEEMDSLFKQYPKWRGIEELTRLNEHVLKEFNALGVYPQEIEQNTQIYVGIDYI
jgi:hypothetical protein